MKAPVKKIRKRDIEWLADHRCRHGVTYLEHYGCYVAEKPQDSPYAERVGFLDIETSNLKASFGYVISYCIKELDGPILEGCVRPEDIWSGDFDRALLTQFNRDVEKFHRIGVYWGRDRRHDLPFLRTRALKLGLDFPLYRSAYVIDLYDWAKNKLSLHSYKLAVVCQELSIPAKGHVLDGGIWVAAMAGRQDALDYILEHNREDVRSTEEVFKRLEPFMANRKTSI